MAGLISKIIGKNLSVKQERYAIGSLIIAAVVIYGYLAPQCWFYEMGYGPAVCQIKSGGFSSGGSSSAGGTCGSCTNGGSCDCPEQSCETCTPPGGQSPCGLADDYTCGGYCPYLYTCTSYSDGCACVPMGTTPDPDCGDDRACGWHSYGDYTFALVGGGDFGYCGGACPVGQTCTQNGDLCNCQPYGGDGDNCYLAGGRTCGGGCSQGMTCEYDSKYEDCYCVGSQIL